MTVLRNNFDGGPDGTDLTAVNSGQVPGNDAFDVMSAPTAGRVCKFADAATLGRGTAEFVLRISTTSTTSNGFAWAGSIGTQTQIWAREYVYFTATPTIVNGLTLFVCDNGAAYTGSIRHAQTNGKLFVFTDDGTVPTSISTAGAMPLNTWIRLEWWFKYSTTVGEVELRIYSTEPDGDDPDEVISASGWNLHAANSNDFNFGSPFAQTGKPTTYFSGLELNNVGWPGPAPFKQHGVPGVLSTPIAVHSDTR